jgi:hypothetical protein
MLVADSVYLCEEGVKDGKTGIPYGKWAFS